MNRYYQTGLACFALFVMVLSLYYPLSGHDFLNMDDPFFIDTHHVPEGLTPDNLKRAFTMHYGMWMPLTWLSHMADSQLYGLRPAGHHLTSLFIHCMNTLLVFLVFTAMTGAFYRSWLGAAIFALHPLNVEPVAYIACRKGLLAALFWLAAILAYSGYTRHKSVKRYLLTVLLFVLGLMAKPVLVTLPLIFLLLDFWPLNRFQTEKPVTLVKEKIPLLILSLLAGLVAIFTQQQAQALSTLSSIPLSDRIASVLVSYTAYLGHIFLPSGLAVFYPWPHNLPGWKVLSAGVLLLLLTIKTVSSRSDSPYAVTGWFWFIIVLLPVSGLIPLGSHAMADRYAYIPIIGIIIVVVWGGAAIVKLLHVKTALICLFILPLLLFLGLSSRRQLGYWENDETVFRHALEVTTGNYAAHNNLARALLEKGDREEALRHLNMALMFHPAFPQAHNNMGVLLAAEGRMESALSHFSRAIDLRPDFAEAHYNMANALLAQKAHTEALTHFRRVLEINPEYKHAADIHYHIGAILLSRQQTQKARTRFHKARSIAPGHIGATTGLAGVYKASGEYDRAIALYKEMLLTHPECSISITYNLACLSALQNEPQKAAAWLEKSIDEGFCQYDLLKSDPDLQNIRQTPCFQSLIGGNLETDRPRP